MPIFSHESPHEQSEPDQVWAKEKQEQRTAQKKRKPKKSIYMNFDSR